MAAPLCSSVSVSLMLLLLVLSASASAASAADGKLIHLHFYFHEVDAGTPNATVVNVASLHKNASTFGDLNVFDNALREGADPASRLIGRAQGIGVHASLDESGGLTAIDFAFSDYGEYSGSTLATTGHFTVSAPSERSIVGGTGKLRFARGYLTSRLLSSTDTSIVVVFDMYFTLAHWH
ncbi:pterocarpan synthase 1 isoform 1 precursor [Zea mays]|uniref:Dirigent protein n=3 Tax=Zea mays TaxID=4577 RepID=A0A1D6DUL3_MAIZE|nr:pterocarpan synthase 1 precursor 1 precursor [Zea mays]ONM12507.1 Transport protein particle (TRAPP) component [Zea mays]